MRNITMRNMRYVTFRNVTLYKIAVTRQSLLGVVYFGRALADNDQTTPELKDIVGILTLKDSHDPDVWCTSDIREANLAVRILSAKFRSHNFSVVQEDVVTAEMSEARRKPDLVLL